MPPSAVADMLEWGPEPDAERQFAAVLHQELSLDGLIDKAPGVSPLQDDRPINEYFILRRVQDAEYRRALWQKILTRLGMKS
jgi:hypothetical protein